MAGLAEGNPLLELADGRKIQGEWNVKPYARVEPDVSIWYHQPWGAVLACRGRPELGARYATLAKMRTSCRGRGPPGRASTRGRST